MDEDRDQQRESGALADLIGLEARVEAELASAIAEAQRIVDAARRDAESLDRDGVGELESELADLRAAIDRESQARIRDLEERADAEEARYRGVDTRELEHLARWVATRVAGGGSEP